MTDRPTSARLYSQTESDARGNFVYEGDLHRPGLTLPGLTSEIERHLEGMVAGGRFSVRGESFAGGRKVIVDVLDVPADLSLEEARHRFETMLRDQVERFGFTRSNILQDYMTCSFYSDVRISRSYWAVLASRNGSANPVASTMPLAAFKRAVRPGDQLRLVAAPAGHRSLGTVRSIVAVRSADLVLEGPSYLTLPGARAFACDGTHVRIAIGNERRPDDHLLYEWIRQAA